MNIDFVDCDERQLPAVVEFFQRCYSPTYRLAADLPLLRWQFGGPTPEAGRYHLKLATRGATVLGCLGFVPAPLDVAGSSFRAAWTANWMVDPAHRRLGLGPLLLRQLMAEFDAVLSVGLERDAVDLLPRMGWEDFGDLTRYAMVLDRAGLARLTGSVATVDVGPTGQYRPSMSSPDVVAASPAAAGTEVWDRVWGRHGAGTRRTAAFLDWRYRRHPVFDYHSFVSGQDQGPPTGFVVYRIERVRDLPVSVGRIVELVAEPAAVPDLLATVAGHARAAGVAVLDYFCSGRRFDAAVVASGFLPGDCPEVRDLPLLFQPVNRDRRAIRFMGYVARLPAGTAGLDWYVTRGDGDQDRPN
ncbi:MAG: GNAT family N-acetyltransferase [Vicinamibacterales bacterium]